MYPVSMMRVPAMERPTLCVGPGVSNANLQLLDVQLFADKAAEFVPQLSMPWYRGLSVVLGIVVNVMLLSMSFQNASLGVKVPYEISPFQREIPTIVDWY